ncbi:MAG: HAD family phosphatase [Caldilineaceae bacterium]|nr:HAD family phosphatase [Caldilineaceae bacterium]
MNQLPTHNPSTITTLFLDIGGVLLTNGWDHLARQRAATTFALDYDELDERHHLTFDTYEEGKLSLDDYLSRVIFYRSRSFSVEDFKTFMFAQSQPYPAMLTLFRQLKAQYGLTVAAISNEGRELTIHRIQQFKLKTLFDCFISSCFVHYRKPDPDIYTMALDVAQAAPHESLYIDDRAMFVDIARGLGLQGIHHTDYAATCATLKSYGLVTTDGEADQ